MSARRGRGTDVRGEPDLARIAAGLARPGIDTRVWVERGTVATVGGESGVPDFGDGNAILVDTAGVDVDVVLGTDEHPVTCRWGLTYGDVCIVPPIRPGDHVLVEIPGGDLANVPEIIKVLAGTADPVPTGGDGMPLFKNDRLLIHARNVPIDLRTAGGARVLMAQDGTVVLNEGERGVARVKDATKLAMQPQEVVKLAAALLATGAFLPTGSPPAPPPPAMPADEDFPTASVIFESGEIVAGSGTVKAGG